MEKRFVLFAALLSLVFAWGVPVKHALASEPIILGVPTSLGFLEGKEGMACLNMAVDEINEAGGVDVGGTQRLFKVVSIDARGAEPGVPVADVIRAHKKLILEDKANFIVFGSFRSECAIACMDTVSQYKIPMILGTAMSPGMDKKVKTDYDKYKYTFRTCLNAVYLIKYLGGTMAYLNKQFGFNKVFIMNQDVAWARKTGDLMIKLVFDKMGWEVVGRQAYPTGASDFSSALMKARASKAQVILPIFDMPQGGILVKQWKTMKVPALIAGFIFKGWMEILIPIHHDHTFMTFPTNLITVSIHQGFHCGSVRFMTLVTFSCHNRLMNTFLELPGFSIVMTLGAELDPVSSGKLIMIGSMG